MGDAADAECAYTPIQIGGSEIADGAREFGYDLLEKFRAWHGPRRSNVTSNTLIDPISRDLVGGHVEHAAVEEGSTVFGGWLNGIN